MCILCDTDQCAAGDGCPRRPPAGAHNPHTRRPRSLRLPVSFHHFSTFTRQNGIPACRSESSFEKHLATTIKYCTLQKPPFLCYSCACYFPCASTRFGCWATRRCKNPLIFLKRFVCSALRAQSVANIAWSIAVLDIPRSDVDEWVRGGLAYHVARMDPGSLTQTHQVSGLGH